MVSHREPEEFYLSTALMIQSMNRWEYLVEDDEGNTTALMVLYDDYDMHVGRCLSVLCAFSTNPRALFGGYKWFMSVAKELGYEFIAYTKVTSDFEMSLKYKRVNIGNS